jgi:4-aminobutyrate aminotransferase-like enzyme
LIGKGGIYGNTLRIAPALSLTEAEADEGYEKLARAVERVAG